MVREEGETNLVQLPAATIETIEMENNRDGKQ